MQSLQVRNVTPNTLDQYTHLQVCRSAAGWYVGTMHKEDGITSPGSRDTGYFATEIDAAFVLQLIVRMHYELCRLRKNGRVLGEDVSDLTDEDFAKDVAAVLVMCGLDKGEVGYRLNP